MTDERRKQLVTALADAYDDWEGCDYADLQHLYRTTTDSLKAQIADLDEADGNC